MIRRTIASLLPLAAMAACSSSSSSPAGDPSNDPLPEGAVGFEMALSVPPSSEQHKCQLKMPDHDSFIVGMSHTYTPGSHHLLLYRTDLATIPAGGDQLVDCFESPSAPMSHVRGIVYGSQVPKGDYALPAGVGLQVKANEVLLFQSHYINPGDAAIDAKVNVRLQTTTEGITEHAGTLFLYDPFIAVPARGQARASMRCEIPSDIHLLTGFSHYHARGTTFSAFLDAPDGSKGQTPFYTSTDWEHPSALEHTVEVKAGSRLRFQCNYDNASGTQEFFQGQSAATDEMCMFSGIYYPDMGDDANLCLHSADMFGTGTTSCWDTLKCVQACPAGTAPDGETLLGTQAKVDPCWQKCFANSCPTATGLLYDQLGCIQAHCPAECADPSAKACTFCAAQNCLTQVNACQQAPCE